ncbi:MAG: hemerythrin domain-containing protein [Alphaproteobacteria bacterium]|nr:hemerythrin domain-containing protein [Alphaproteobacteria bacterium]
MPRNTTPNAIAMLKADHRKVEGLFAKFEKAKDADRKKALAGEICLELRVHATIEEDVFYPACREAGVDEDLMNEANVEHDSAKVLITEIENSEPGDEFYDAKVKVLSEQIKHHVKEEEKKQGNIFTKARKAGLDLEDLGQRMAAEKEELLAKLEAGSRPKPATPSFQSTRLAA